MKGRLSFDDEGTALDRPRPASCTRAAKLIYIAAATDLTLYVKWQLPQFVKHFDGGEDGVQQKFELHN